MYLLCWRRVPEGCCRLLLLCFLLTVRSEGAAAVIQSEGRVLFFIEEKLTTANPSQCQSWPYLNILFKNWEDRILVLKQVWKRKPFLFYGSNICGVAQFWDKQYCVLHQLMQKPLHLQIYVHSRRQKSCTHTKPGRLTRNTTDQNLSLMNHVVNSSWILPIVRCVTFCGLCGIWPSGQTKNWKYTSDAFFRKIVSLILGVSDKEK